MKIYSVDSTESRENQNKIISKILPQVGLDLRHLRLSIPTLQPTELLSHVLTVTGN